MVTFRKQLLTAATVMALSTMAAMPAKAADPVANWVGNVLFGWTDAGKSCVHNTQKYGAVGLVTCPVTGAVNVAVRYSGNVLDLAVVPLTGKNALPPPVVGSGINNPPVKF